MREAGNDENPENVRYLERNACNTVGAFSALFSMKMRDRTLLCVRILAIWPQPLGVGIGDGLFRSQQEPPENLAITLHGVAVVFCDQSLPFGCIVGWQLVPGQGGLAVVGDMQVVVKEKQ